MTAVLLAKIRCTLCGFNTADCHTVKETSICWAFLLLFDTFYIPSWQKKGAKRQVWNQPGNDLLRVYPNTQENHRQLLLNKRVKQKDSTSSLDVRSLSKENNNLTHSTSVCMQCLNEWKVYIKCMHVGKMSKLKNSQPDLNLSMCAAFLLRSPKSTSFHEDIERQNQEDESQEVMRIRHIKYTVLWTNIQSIFN